MHCLPSEKDILPVSGFIKSKLSLIALSNIIRLVWLYDINYEETFAPIARMASVRSFLAIVAAKQWPLI